MMRTFDRWVRRVRDVGLIFGVPTLIGIGIYLYNMEAASLKARSEALEAEISLLKETQFDRTASLLDAKRSLLHCS
jgi:hypothetical protein